MARVLAISSQVAYGPVGLTALVPALQAASHEVLAVPTVTLSNHPGHGKPAGLRIDSLQIDSILTALSDLGALKTVDAVLTGYFASAAQVEVVARRIAEIRAANPHLLVLVDPVIGDGDALYVQPDIAVAIRDNLLPLATIITPNVFELSWLTGKSLTAEASAIIAARTLAPQEILVTSIPDSSSSIATLLVTPDTALHHVSHRYNDVPHGTGDFLSGLYLAARLGAPPPQAFATAMRQLDHSITISAGSPVLNVAGALHGISPASKQPAP